MAEAKMHYDIASWIRQLSEDLFFKDMEPKKIIKSGDRTIVFWKDNTKTIVKRSDDADDDLYSAFCAALAIKLYGSNSQVKKILRMAEIQPKSDRIIKKEREAYKKLNEKLREKEEAERSQKIISTYVERDPIENLFNNFKEELDKKIDNVEKQIGKAYKREK